MERIKKEAKLLVRDSQKEKESLMKSYMREQKLRKKFYNQLEDMKGKVRVYCRVRPLNKKEKARGCQQCVSFKDDDTIIVTKDKKDFKFVFDVVFQPGSKQSEVFADTKRLMQSAIDGYNVCIFAYGQ